MARVLVPVLSAEEDWRNPQDGFHRRGQVHLWIRLTCGHYPVQRAVKPKRDGSWTAPKRVRCEACERGEPVES